MTYRVVLSRQARRYFATAPPPLARRLADVFESLEEDARPEGAKPLRGDLAGLWRLRLGTIRIIYELKQDADEIRIVRIGPRGDIY